MKIKKGDKVLYAYNDEAGIFIRSYGLYATVKFSKKTLFIPINLLEVLDDN